MSYNPKLHHRRSIRLKGYDYSKAGSYFITICCNDMVHRFGKVENDEMVLNEFGQIAYDEWINLAERFTNFELDVFQIMPNHMHGIIALNEFDSALFPPAPKAIAEQKSVRAGFTPAPSPLINNSEQKHNPEQKNENLQQGENPEPENIIMRNDNGAGAGVNPAPTTAPTIGDIVGAYKSLVANACLDIYKSKNETMGKLWQRDYYEHIIRNEKAYQRISDYIINNPAKWKEDKFRK